MRSRCAQLLHAAAQVALLTLGLSTTSAQTASSIDGVVVDATGAVLPAVTITLIQPSTGANRTAITDSRGVFRAPLLPVGVYELTATAAGFEARKQSGVVLTVGQTRTLRIEMTLAGVAESIGVTASASALDRSRSWVAATVDEHAVRNLPVNGRNFIDFALLTAGVARDVRTGDISFAGQRGTLNSLVVDGADNNNTFGGQTLGRTGSGRAPYQFSQDAVKEFQINTNAFSAEYGRAGGAVINVVTKSGTNERRGSVFEFYRDKALNATDAINARQGLPKGPYHYHQFGGTLGGPIRVNRDFFFVNYDGQRNTQPNTVFLNLPSTPPTDASALAAIDRLQPFAFSWQRHLDQDVVLVKTDHEVNARHRLSFRYNHQDFTGTGYESGGNQNAWEHSGDSFVQTRTVTATAASQLRTRFFNELRVQYARDWQTGTANTDMPEAIVQEGGRRVLAIGRNFFSPRETLLDRAQIADTLTWLRGRHLLKGGFDFQFDRIANDFPGYFSGSYRFASLAAFERKTASFYRQDFPGPGTSGARTRPDLHEYSFFIQDEWRPVPNLTLNGGLRYDLMKAARPTVRNPDAELAAADIDTSRLNPDADNWGPRLGVAWNPRAGRAVLRAGAGLFYGRTPAIVATAAANNGINIVSLTFTGPDVPTYPHTFAEIPDRGTPGQPTIFHVEKDYANPRLVHVNTSFGWEPVVGTSLTVTFLHVTGRDLPRSVDRNLGALEHRAFNIDGTSEVTSYHRFGDDRPFSRFGRVVAFEASAESKYDGMTVDVLRRVSDDTHLRLAYTLGKVVDTNPDATAVATDDIRFASNPVDFDTDRTVGDNDRRHRLVASATYSPSRLATVGRGVVRVLGRGWSFGAIFTAESGRPYSARMMDIDLNNDGNRFNDLAPGTRRNAFRLPAIVTFDTRIARDIPLRGAVRAQLIVEAFNLFNRSNINAVIQSRYTLQGTTLRANPAFGQPTATAGERIVQLALRVMF